MPKSKSQLDELTPQQQELIVGHCDRPSMTLEAGAKWLFDEFGIHSPKDETQPLSGTAFGRWLEKQRIDRAFQEQLSDIRADRERSVLLNKEVGDVIEILEANATMSGQALFEALRTKNPVMIKKAASTFGGIIKNALKHRDQKIKAEAVALDVEKYKNSLRSKLDAGLDALAESVKGNDVALGHYRKLKEAIAKS